MSMLKHEMKTGVKCYVKGHAIQGDMRSPMIDSRGTIVASPLFSTVLVDLDNPPKGLESRCNVPLACVYWTKQD